MANRTLLVLMLVGCLLAVSETSEAQPYALDPNIKPVQLTLRDYPDGNGVMWTAATGASQGVTDYLYVGALSARRATEVYLMSLSATNAVSMELAQGHWDETLDSCTTDDSGMCGIKFRAHGDLGFRINAPEETAWQLVIMTSPEVAAAELMPSPLFEARKADAARYEVGAATAPSVGTTNMPVPESGRQPDWLAPVAVGLLAVIVILLFLLLRNRKSPAALLLFATLLTASPDEFAYGVSESTAGTLDALGRQLDQTQANNAEIDGIRSRLESNSATLLKRLEILMALKGLIDEWNPLNPCATVANPPSTPRIPTFCEGDSECESCYGTARDKFNQVRSVFEDLRVIYQCSMNDINSALAFGDTASGVHGVVGLTWKAERTKIERSVNELKKAYDNKYADLRGRLHESMIELGSCEAMYGEPDWYDRFGYVYFEFLTDKYKRQD
ncbi:MAG TPA: hypothetical protein PKH39_01960 [Woeseiaceae bacterium]|nr:hypothetical protein [Woeseiaceae bacterium]